MSHISWDEYFMGVALLSSFRSKDPNTKVGACIVNKKNRIVGIGYNGFPYGCDDSLYPWENSKDLKFLDTKYPYVVHAEPNAILNSSEPLDGATLYVTLFPCNECAKLIIQSGIKHIVFMNDKYHDTEASQASRKMFDSAQIDYRLMKEVKIDFKCEE